jgi:PAS domain S-box-containing protein
MEEPTATGTFAGDSPRVSDPEVLRDRSELAIVAFERTRMPIVITDPRKPDNPIVLANEAFLELTGYGAAEVLGRNCRFLQGPATDPADVQVIRDGMANAHEDINVELLNYRKDGSTFWNQLVISPVHDDAGNLIYFFSSQKDVSSRRRAQELERIEHVLLKEVDHRALNALALVQSIIRLSRRDTIGSFAQAVSRRVDALAHAHRLLAQGSWLGADLMELIGPEAHNDAFLTQGPQVTLPPRLVQPLAIVLQELTSNAREHGALSTPLGRILVSWTVAPRALEISWEESWQPSVMIHHVRGLGLDLIEGIVGAQLAGKTAFDWRPDGLGVTLTVPW